MSRWSRSMQYLAWLLLVLCSQIAIADPSIRIVWAPANVGRGQITLTLDSYNKKVRYGEYSTAASLAASLGGTISLDPAAPIWAKGYADGTVAVRYRQGSPLGLKLQLCMTPDGALGCTTVAGVQLTADLNAVLPPLKKTPKPPPANTSIYAYSIQDQAGSSGFAANGNITAYSDSVNGVWTAAYDALNRLTSATQSQGNGVPALAFGSNTQQGFCWSYDSFGNRLAQAVSDRTIGPDCGPNGSARYAATTASYNVANQFVAVSGTPSPYLYDQAGNVTDDGYHLYLYDADGHVCAVQAKVTGGVTGYRYDAEGNRVAKGTLSSFSCDSDTNGFNITNEYVIGPSGEALTELDGSGTLLHTNAYAGGMLVATYDAGLDVHFQFTDWLGSRRVQTAYNGAVEETCSSGAFGDQQQCTGAGDATGPTEKHFTGKERDTESGLDYFGARYYGSSMGRFMSPDWSSKPQAVPYASLANPQSLNLYSYVNNNPLSQVDADGHFASPWHFLLTFVAAIATGHDPIHAAILAGKNVMVDFRKGSQSGDPAATHVHAMAAAGESPAQAYAGTAQTVSQEEASGDVAGAQHTIQDSYASGHDYSTWAPQDGAFGGLGFWGTVKHEIGDWLPSPAALWGALKGSYNELEDNNASPDSTLHPAPSGGGAIPGGMPNCIGCITPPGYTPPAPVPPPVKPDQFHVVTQ